MCSSLLVLGLARPSSAHEELPIGTVIEVPGEHPIVLAERLWTVDAVELTNVALMRRDLDRCILQRSELQRLQEPQPGFWKTGKGRVVLTVIGAVVGAAATVGASEVLR